MVRKWTIKKAILDIPNDRSSHTIPTPRGGGIAIALVWFISLLILKLTDNIENQLFFALLSGAPLSFAGFLDDVLHLKAKTRFLIQFFCAGLALFSLGGLHVVDLGFYSFENSWLLTLLAFIGIIWLTNLFNFLDGIDGYISTEVIFIGIATFLLLNDCMALLLSVIVLGFLFWNWQKAKIFMGDVGSTLLGFTIAIFAIYQQNNELSSILIWIMLTSLFWVDATVTLMRRYWNKEQLSQAHRKHAYQRIVQSGFSHQKTVLYSLSLNLLALFLIICAIHFKSLMLVFACLNILILWFTIKWVDKRKPFEKNAR
ncbi:MAG: glycosyltransferase family 4 protein [Bacteroidota bacterium]|nr:glycosyltransferase family 4 protein [Bacteroidota bacterium]